jgi:hypothetical protein
MPVADDAKARQLVLFEVKKPVALAERNGRRGGPRLARP